MCVKLLRVHIVTRHYYHFFPSLSLHTPLAMGVRVLRTKHPVAGKQPEQGGVRVTDRGLGAAGSCWGPSANLSSSSSRIMEGRGCSRPHHLQPHRASRCRHTAEAARPPRSTPSPPTRPLFLAIDFIFMVGRGIVCHRPCSRNRSTGLGCALTTQSLSREAIFIYHFFQASFKPVRSHGTASSALR